MIRKLKVIVYFAKFFLSKFKYFCFVTILDMSLISRSCKNDHIIFNVGTPSLEARNIRLVNIITYIIEESKLISENMSPNHRRLCRVKKKCSLCTLGKKMLAMYFRYIASIFFLLYKSACGQMSFIVKFCVTRHQFHVFQTFLHRLLRPKKGSSPRIFI